MLGHQGRIFSSSRCEGLADRYTGPPARLLSCPNGRVLTSRVKKSAASTPSAGIRPHFRNADANSSSSAGAHGSSAWPASKRCGEASRDNQRSKLTWREQAGAGSYLSAETLPAGRWIARVTIAVGDQRWMDEAEVQ